jgi:hypothetical protein
MSEKLPAIMAMKAGGQPLAIVPQTFEDCYRMAKLLAASGMVPDGFKGNPDACCVAILQGLEVGLSPMAALQSIAVINGRPSIWGDGALAIVRASGMLEGIRETDDGKEAVCEVKRKGDAEPVVRKFSEADAQIAGLATKTGPWKTYPRRMRQMRARSWALRDGFADVLKGLHIGEEAQDIPIRDITPAKAQIELQDIPDAEPAIDVLSPAEAAERLAPEEPLANPAAFKARLKDALALATDDASVMEVWDSDRDIVEARLSRSDRSECEGYYDDAMARVRRPVAAE